MTSQLTHDYHYLLNNKYTLLSPYIYKYTVDIDIDVNVDVYADKDIVIVIVRVIDICLPYICMRVHIRSTQIEA